MKPVRVGSVRSRYYKVPCRVCGKPAEVGQVVMGLEIPELPLFMQYVVFHVECLRRRVERAPVEEHPDPKVQTTVALRERIMVTGRAFPDEGE